MSPILYHSVLSPSSRAVLLTMRNLDLDEFEVKNIDLHMDELNSPEYLKIDELHQVPVYVDGEFMLTESRAIMCYLGSSLKKFYPSDLKKRALIDSRLYFDGTNSFAIMRDFWVSHLLKIMLYIDNLYNEDVILLKLPAFRGKKKISLDQREGIKMLLNKLESFLLKSNWFAGDDLTIADFSFLATVATIKVRLLFRF